MNDNGKINDRDSVSPAQGSHSSELLLVARFHEREAVDGFCAVVSECAIPTRVVEPRGARQGFDMTLGAGDHAMGFAVYVPKSRLSDLRKHLAATMEIDPLDPMHGASRAELTAIMEGVTDGNLCEQIVAAKILESRPPETETDISASNKAQEALADTHVLADRKTAAWLGIAGLLFTAGYLALHLPETFADTMTIVAPRATSDGRNSYTGMYEYTHDPISTSLRPFLMTAVPMGCGAALLLSKRSLRNGTTRPMFPNPWRWIGGLLFWLPALLLLWQMGVGFALSHRDR